MSADDHVSSPFMGALKSKGNLVLLAFGTLFLVDLFLGSPITGWIIETTGRVQGKSGGGNIRVLTPFGVFTDRQALARLYDYLGSGLPFLILIPVYLHSAYVSFRQRKMGMEE